MPKERREKEGTVRTRGVVVVAVDGEDGHLDVKVGVLVVHALELAVERERLVRHDLDAHRAVAEAVLAHQLHRWPSQTDGM